MGSGAGESAACSRSIAFFGEGGATSNRREKVHGEDGPASGKKTAIKDGAGSESGDAVSRPTLHLRVKTLEENQGSL